MRKLIMWNLLTLDGYFEGAQSWALDWHKTVWGDELERFCLDQLRTAEVLLFGRITYEGMAAYWRTAQGEVARFMNSLPKIVFSRTLGRPDWTNTILVQKDAAAFVRELKPQGAGNMFVFGSADLSATFANADLFDEYRLMIVPIILGSGHTLFGRNLHTKPLRLLETRPFASGGIILRYAPAPGA